MWTVVTRPVLPSGEVMRRDASAPFALPACCPEGPASLTTARRTIPNQNTNPRLLTVTCLVYRARLELAFFATQADPPAHDVQRQENQGEDENQDLEGQGVDVHTGVIGMTLKDFRPPARSGRYN